VLAVWPLAAQSREGGDIGRGLGVASCNSAGRGLVRLLPVLGLGLQCGRVILVSFGVFGAKVNVRYLFLSILYYWRELSLDQAFDVRKGLLWVDKKS
jgi:hypothetical protein